jgi:hypothetical protein
MDDRLAMTGQGQKIRAYPFPSLISSKRAADNCDILDTSKRALPRQAEFVWTNFFENGSVHLGKFEISTGGYS